MLFPSTTGVLSGPGGPQNSLDCKTIRGSIDRWARDRGNDCALVDFGQALSYAQLSAFVARCADELARSGLGPGCRVGVIAAANAAGARATLAVTCSCVLVPIGAAMPPAELLDSIRIFELGAIVVGPELPQALHTTVLTAGITVLQYGDHGLTVLMQGPPPSHAMSQKLAGVALLLRSSGTTGRPKIVAVSHENMIAMALKLGSAEWLGIGPADRTVATLPLHYAAGLKNLLLVPAILGGCVAFPPVGRAMEIETWLPRLRPTYLCTSPGTLRALVERLTGARSSLSGSTLRFIMCGASYVSDELHAAAQALFGVPVLEFYGLSEAGVMAANPPGRSKRGTVGLVAQGELFITDASGRELPPGETGQIVVRGPSVSPGYVVDARLAGEQVHSGCLSTGDVGWVDEQGYLTISGRTKEVINRGGEKVFPYEVEKALLEHPDVLEAAVFGVPHARLGEGVAAAIVPKPGSSVSVQDLTSFLAARIARFKIPHGIRVLSVLPRGPTGKVLRPRLAEQHLLDRPAPVVPVSFIEGEVQQVWHRLLGNDAIGVDDDFYDRGGDSLLAADMLLEVERLACVSLEEFQPAVLTIRAVAEAVVDGLPVGPALITPVKQGSGIPLFFCHGDHIARGVYARRLAAHLPDRRPVFLVNCAEDDALADIETVAAGYLPDLLRAARGSPVFVGGYCVAGLMAWQIAHLLRARGVEVAGVLLVETLSFNGGRGMRTLGATLRHLGELLPGRAGGFVRNEAMRGFWALKRKGPREFAAALVERSRKPAMPTGRHVRYAQLEVNNYGGWRVTCRRASTCP
jgi:oxalate---CoA ligase